MLGRPGLSPNLLREYPRASSRKRRAERYWTPTTSKGNNSRAEDNTSRSQGAPAERYLLLSWNRTGPRIAGFGTPSGHLVLRLCQQINQSGLPVPMPIQCVTRSTYNLGGSSPTWHMRRMLRSRRSVIIFQLKF